MTDRPIILTRKEYRVLLLTYETLGLPGTPSLGYPESTLQECTCAGGTGLPHHERCPMRGR